MFDTNHCELSTEANKKRTSAISIQTLSHVILISPPCEATVYTPAHIFNKYLSLWFSSSSVVPFFIFLKFLNVSRYQRPPAAAFTPAQGLFIFLIIYSHSWWLSHSLEASRHIIRPVGSSSTPPCTASPPSSASWWRYNAPSTAAAFFSTAFDLPLLLVCAAPNSARQACNPQHS